MMSFRSLKTRFAQWRRDEEGSVSVEVLMTVPLLAWAMLATLTYFHAYRAEAISEKASLTIADMISREADYITPDYIEGARGLLKFLSIEDRWPDLRITVVEYDGDVQRYERVWSKEKGPRSPLTNAQVIAMADKLPVMSDNEQAIVVETWTEYNAPYGVGLDSFDMTTMTVISPRFVTQVCWNATPDQGMDTATCRSS